jgi:hypothetical protein
VARRPPQPRKTGLEEVGVPVQDRSAVRILFIPLAAAGFAFGLVTAAIALIGDPSQAAERPTALVWADRVFSTKQGFAAWLESRGGTYEAWADRHPAAVAVLDPEARTAAAPTHSTPLRRTAATRALHGASGDSGVAIGLIVGSVLGLLALLLMVRLGPVRLPRRHVRRRHWRKRPPGLTPVKVGTRRLGAGSLGAVRAAASGRSGRGLTTPDEAGAPKSPPSATLPLRERWIPQLGLHRVRLPQATVAKAVANSLAASRGAVRAAASVLSRNGRGLTTPDEAGAPTSPPRATLSLRERRISNLRPQRVRLPQATVAKAVANSRAASRGAWAELAQRLAMRRSPDDGARRQGDPWELREKIHRAAPDLLWGATALLLAVVVGVSIAMYMN